MHLSNLSPGEVEAEKQSGLQRKKPCQKQNKQMKKARCDITHLQSQHLRGTVARGSLSSRPAWTTEQVPDSQGYVEILCLKRKIKGWVSLLL